MHATVPARLTTGQRVILGAILTALLGLPPLLLWSALSAHGHKPVVPAAPHPVVVVNA